jgi:hypothetical protein
VKRAILAFTGLALMGGPVGQSAWAASIDPAFAASYSLTDLGAVPGLPESYGGV